MLLTIPQRIQAISPPIRTLAAEDACAECQNNQGVVIDVREPEEHAKDAVPGAVNIPRGLLEMKALEMIKQADQTIYLHCATGARAQLAAEQLRNMGYENVTAMTCGIKQLQSAFSK